MTSCFKGFTFFLVKLETKETVKQITSGISNRKSLTKKHLGREICPGIRDVEISVDSGSVTWEFNAKSIALRIQICPF